uniref:Saccharopine dehydrogenase NADP binding domain-containing protein n=1 Tax=Kwoniella pini CBS 10737 TaxID=1296096 RepID=A0A1B9I188_9TREE|nr:uncharacterized protein I206_05003 [Kwoniella pini CBS 10737]OCF49312.1 hypothetical protein I206_05003 [Kwoniella pini CBS 10737]
MAPANKPSSKPTLIIYGATSFTARQLLAYLDNHPDKASFEFILAGRNQEKLESTNVKLSYPREIVACQLNDEDGVKSLVEKGDVVVNLAASMIANLLLLYRECVKTGKHYVDLCGESSWLATDIIPRYNDLAIKSKSCIIPSCGFDSIPSDLTLYLAHKTLQAKYPELTINDSQSFFKIKGGSMSGGTIQSMYAVAELPKDKRRSGEYDCIPSDGMIIKSNSTIPKLIYKLEIPNKQKRFGSFFFMYPYNRTIIRRTQYLSNLFSLNENVNENEIPKYGKIMKYEESMETGNGKLGSSFISFCLFFLFGLFYSSKFIRNICSYFLPKAGEGVSDEQLFKASYIVENLSSSTSLPNGKNVKVITTFKGQGDPGYLNTCYLLAESALSLVLSKDQLPTPAKKGGMLTPSIAMGDILIDRLNKSGKFEISSEILVLDTDKKID